MMRTGPVFTGKAMDAQPANSEVLHDRRIRAALKRGDRYIPGARLPGTGASLPIASLVACTPVHATLL